MNLMRTITLVMAFCLALCASTYALERAPAQVVRIICDDVGNSVSMGSGVYCQVAGDDVSFVLTNHHVIADAANRGAVTVRFTSINRDVRAFIAASEKDGDEDLALLLLYDRVPVQPLEIADAEANSGYIYGFGPNQRLMGSKTAIGTRGQWYWTPTPVRQGDSGSPILDENRRVVGVIWGSDSTESVGTRLPVLRAFVGNTLRALKQRMHPRQWFGGSGGGCYNGRCPTPTRPSQPRQPYYLQPIGQEAPRPDAPQSPPPASPPDTTDKDCPECEERFGKLEQRLDELADSQQKLSDAVAENTESVIGALENQAGRLAKLEARPDVDTTEIDSKLADLSSRLSALSKPMTVVFEKGRPDGSDKVVSVPPGGEIRLPTTEFTYVNEDTSDVERFEVPVGGRLGLGFGVK